VIIGGSFAYILCILIALVIGALVEKILNERALNIIGGLLFLFFAVYMLIFEVIMNDDGETTASS
jgi:putative Ca2+/H+ antiporter (TMEM165/GDT1 family)